MALLCGTAAILDAVLILTTYCLALGLITQPMQCDANAFLVTSNTILHALALHKLQRYVKIRAHGVS